MSALSGIYNFDGAPANERVLSVLRAGLDIQGPDGGNEVCSDSVIMVYRAFHTSKESRLENQPLRATRGLILTWDGRLDNRNDLLPQLCESFTSDKTYVTDAAIVLVAFEKWGADCFSKLVGEFAVAIWDPRARTLLMARDPFGIRPLYYYVYETGIVWSSDLKSLTDSVRIPLEIDDDYIAGFLTQFPEPWQTPYKNFHAVPPANIIIIKDGQIKAQRFWSLDPGHEVNYKTDAEYEEHFRFLFRESIRCRLRADSPVWSELSGGLDSSSIVCMADHIYDSGEAQTPNLETVSYVYDESPTSDERNFIHAVEKQRGRSGYHIREEDCRLFAPSAELFFATAPAISYFYYERRKALSEAMQLSGARILLSGHGGDQLLISNEDPDTTLADLISHLNVSRLHRCLRSWASALKKPYIQLLWSGAVLLLPRSVQMVCRRITKLPDLLDKRFVARMGMRERMLGPKDPYGFPLPSKQDQVGGLLSVVRSTSAAHLRDYGRIENSFPYLHSPLVEFLMAIPIEQKVRPGESRSLMRRSLQPFLPEKIVRRRGKKGPNEALCRGLTREWPRLQHIFADPYVCARGYADSELLKEALAWARHGAETNTFALFKIIALEFWLRSLEQRGSILRNNPITGVVAARTTVEHASAETASM